MAPIDISAENETSKDSEEDPTMPNVTIASGSTIASVAALIGDVARASILATLMNGKALTAGELARVAGITPQTASGHLAKLVEAQLVRLEKQGRYHYYHLASSEVAQALEALSVVAATRPTRYYRPGPKDEALRTARTCYDHIAGRLGLAIADSMQNRNFVILSEGAGLLTQPGNDFLRDFGIDLYNGDQPKRPICRTCLDWSERRHHLAGRLGVALLNRMLELNWIRRVELSRALSISRVGEQGLMDIFDIRPDLVRVKF